MVISISQSCMLGFFPIRGYYSLRLVFDTLLDKTIDKVVVTPSIFRNEPLNISSFAISRFDTLPSSLTLVGGSMPTD